MSVDFRTNNVKLFDISFVPGEHSQPVVLALPHGIVAVLRVQPGVVEQAVSIFVLWNPDSLVARQAAAYQEFFGVVDSVPLKPSSNASR